MESDAVTVNVTGTPTLKLNDGGTATYVGGSGTSSLTFKTTVASTDTTTSALARALTSRAEASDGWPSGVAPMSSRPVVMPDSLRSLS